MFLSHLQSALARTFHTLAMKHLEEMISFLQLAFQKSCASIVSLSDAIALFVHLGQVCDSSNRPQLPSEPTQSPRARPSLLTWIWERWKVAIECYPLLNTKMHKILLSPASFSVSFHRLNLEIGSSIELVGSTELPSLRLEPLV